MKRFIGKYLVESEIGTGGMATVYRAYQESLERAIAIKELKSSYVSNPLIVERFEREAKTAASLQHENIIHVYDYWKRGNSFYIIMEFVDGVDLAEIIRQRGKIPYRIAAMIAYRVSWALEYAHHKGLVHRDIKPSNIMISQGGEIKLMDFGIVFVPKEAHLTLPGTFLGTPNYMSPEQIIGDQIDGRSDQFSLGIVLYEMLTGAKPFSAEDTDDASVFEKIRKYQPMAIQKLTPDAPFALRRIVKRCLQKNPQRRFSDTTELRYALESFCRRFYKERESHQLAEFVDSLNLVTTGQAGKRDDQQSGELPKAATSRSGRLISRVDDAVRKSTIERPSAKDLLKLSIAAALLATTIFQQERDLNRSPATLGALRVVANPWARVYLDGELLAITPTDKAYTVPIGDHELTFVNPDYPRAKRKIRIAAGETNTVVQAMQR